MYRFSIVHPLQAAMYPPLYGVYYDQRTTMTHGFSSTFIFNAKINIANTCCLKKKSGKLLGSFCKNFASECFRG